MSVRTCTADLLPSLAREFTAGRTVIHVVAATENVGWAAMRTWELARSAATGERRVALIDLSLDEPALDRMAQNTTDEGIVDAFLYGASLSHVARQQDVPTLYYVGVGTRTNQPAEVWANSRWDRLARGFKNEKAVLIVYVPPGALNRCALEADGMIVLAPEGYDPALDVAPGITRKMNEGVPLLAVITAAADPSPPEPLPELIPEPPLTTEPEEPRVWDVSAADPVEPEKPALQQTDNRTPDEAKPPIAAPVDQDDLAPIDLDSGLDADGIPDLAIDLDPIDLNNEPANEPVLPVVPDVDPEDTEEFPTPAPPRRPSRTSIADTPYDGPPIFQPGKRKPIGNILFWIGGGLTVGAVVIGYVLWSGREQPTTGETTAQTVNTTPPQVTTTAPITATTPPTPVEPLAEADSLYYSVQAAALNTLEDALQHGRDLQNGIRPITVTPVRIGGRIWYRVIVGAYPSPEAADAGRRSLWQDGLVANGEGTILRTPQAFSLGRRDTIDSARTEAASLWDRGIPAYVLPHDGGGILAVGAFVRPEQARSAESMLNAASLTTTLAPRLGSTQ